MFFSPQTIGFNGFSMVLGSFNHWFQWFSMVMDHWFDYEMVSMNRSPLVVVVVVVVVVLVVDCWLPYSIYLDLDFHLCTMTEPKEHSREICYLEVVGPFFKKVSCLLRAPLPSERKLVQGDLVGTGWSSDHVQLSVMISLLQTQPLQWRHVIY